MRRLAILAVGVAVTVLYASPGLASTITTQPSWNGTDQVSPFGYPNTETYGQVIQGTGEDLQSFTVYMNLPETTTFRGAVYGWDGSKASGELWLGPDAATSGGGAFQPVTFTLPAGVTLDAGQDYVLLATTTLSSGAGQGQWGLVLSNVYPDGTMVYLTNQGGGAAELTTVDWGTLANFDLAFTAVLDVVPPVPPVPPVVVVVVPQAVVVPYIPLPTRGAYCIGSKFYDLLLGQPTSDSTYRDASPAIFVTGTGITCDPPPAGYVRKGFAGDRQHVPENLYPLYEPAGS